jgi:hypothetical protein
MDVPRQFKQIAVAIHLSLAEGEGPRSPLRKSVKYQNLINHKAERNIWFIFIVAGFVQPQDKIAARSSRNLSLFVVNFQRGLP